MCTVADVNCRPRQWMREVLQPLNEKAAEIVVKHADMLQSNRMEPLLLRLVAHVSAYRVILARCATDWACMHPGACTFRKCLRPAHRASGFLRRRMSPGAALCVEQMPSRTVPAG